MKTLVFIVSCWLGSWIAVEAQSIPIDSLQKRIAKAKLVSDSAAIKSARDSILKVLPKQPPKKLDPKKAARYSAILPGLGQAYNKQYWKMPIVYAGFGAVIYFIRFNSIRYKDFVEPYVASFDATTGKQLREEAEVFVRSQGLTRKLTIDQITQAKDQYRRWRDLNYMLLAGVWALNIVEANVSAHLITFDVSEDISLRWQPDVNFGFFTGGVVGAKVVIGLK